MAFSSVGLGSNSKLFGNESLSPCNQKLSCKDRELKRVGLIYGTLSAKGFVKLR